jgi:hypothetical protein
MADDPQNEAIMRELLRQLDPQPGDDDLPYEDILRRLQTVLLAMVTTGTPPTQEPKPAGEGVVEPTPEHENAVRQAVGLLFPVADDQYAGYETLLRRLQSVVDAELSRWTSAMVQPVGPSGYTAVPEPPPVEPARR